MKLKAFFYILTLSISLASCNPERVRYTNELKQEMADSKIKRITNADLVETIDDLGGKISTVLEKELTAQLQKTTNPAERAKLCQVKNLPRARAIAERYGLDIRLLGEGDIQNQALNAKEREILDAYLYSAKQNISAISNIQKINDTLFVYNSPVPSKSLICETCFPKQETRFAVWHLGFSKREVVRRMSDTKKKKR